MRAFAVGVSLYDLHCSDLVTPLLHLPCFGTVVNRCVLNPCGISALMEGSAGHELSMHANAIAMKYLSDEQLASIAANSNEDPSLQVSSFFLITINQMLTLQLMAIV